MNQTFGSESVAAYYESDENRIWDLLTGGHIHLGYWEQTLADTTLASGALDLTREMIRRTRIGHGQRFCDIGCGVGLPAIQLAQANGCEVDGVTISPFQHRLACRRAQDSGMSGTVRFWLANALSMPFPDQSFDGGWFFESIFHMGHQPALQEAHRVLKPGATLLITDLVDIGILSPEDRQLAKELCNAEYITMDDYPELMRSTGFELEEFLDITPQVMAPLQTHFARAMDHHREEILSFSTPEIYEGFYNVGDQLAGSAGYIIASAKRE